jgi:hypothetical protein
MWKFLQIINTQTTNIYGVLNQNVGEVVQALVRLVQRANMSRECSMETLFGEAIIKTKILYDPSDFE